SLISSLPAIASVTHVSHGDRVDLDTVQDRDLLKFVPELYRQLARRVPIRSLIQLSDVLGGRKVRVPLQASERSAFAGVLTPEEMRHLCAECGGEYVDIPRLTQLHLELRDRQVVRLLKAGSRPSDLALRFNTSERHIWRIAAKRG